MKQTVRSFASGRRVRPKAMLALPLLALLSFEANAGPAAVALLTVAGGSPKPVNINLVVFDDGQVIRYVEGAQGMKLAQLEPQVLAGLMVAARNVKQKATRTTDAHSPGCETAPSFTFSVGTPAGFRIFSQDVRCKRVEIDDEAASEIRVVLQGLDALARFGGQ